MHTGLCSVITTPSIKNLNHRWFSCEHKLWFPQMQTELWENSCSGDWASDISDILLTPDMSVTSGSLISLHQWEFKASMHQLSKKTKQMKTRRNDKTDMASWGWTLLRGNWRWIGVIDLVRRASYSFKYF